MKDAIVWAVMAVAVTVAGPLVIETIVSGDASDLGARFLAITNWPL